MLFMLKLTRILNATTSLQNATIYVTLFPCHECSKLIIQSGIKKVIYANNKYEGTPGNIAAKKMFKEAQVELVFYNDETSY